MMNKRFVNSKYSGGMSKISEAVYKILNGQRVEKITDMIAYNDKIIVGLSGGADSVALTYFLYEISKYYNLEVMGCHINHGIRGNEADADQEFVRIYCDKLNIKLFEMKVNLTEVAASSKMSLEEIGRNVRYKFFKECSEKYNAKIATAHTMSDNAETVILNLIRGSGLKGLCGIPATRENIIRPFINFTREEIEKYCEENSLAFVVDSTNLLDDYSRNLVRHKIIPIICNINPNFLSTINRNCDIILEDEMYLNGIVEDAIKKIYTGNGYNINELNKYSSNIKGRIIKKILKENFLPYEYKKIKLIIDFINGEFLNNGKIEYKLSLSKNQYIEKNGDYFNIKKFVKTSKAKLNVKLYDSCCNNYIKYDIIDYNDIKDDIEKNKRILKCCLDYNKIIGQPILRYKNNGDKIKLAYRNGSKSLKKLFNEEKIPLEHRDKIFVIADDKGVIWVSGFGADERVNVNSSTKKVLFLNFSKNKR